jgi:SAM-dependent MidA family methyltransferase
MASFSNPDLFQTIKTKISSSSQPMISFAEFMEMALYEPNLGYYATSHRQLGPMGDFVTSAHLAQDYGELLAIQLKEFWQILECPTPFTVVEIGAGQGLVSADALAFISQDESSQDFARALAWKIIETSQSLIQWQQHYLGKRLAQVQSQSRIPIEWTSLDPLRSQPIVGCIFSNELVDALPCHLLEVRDGVFQEVKIAVDSDAFVEKLGPLSADLANGLLEMGVHAHNYPEGYRCEVNLAAKAWIESVAEAIAQGFVLTIDYGYTAQQLYSPARQGGTIQCYTQQKSHNNPLINVGNQDITSHVNFTALELYGEAKNLNTLACTQQGLFLMALGLGDRLVTNNTNTDLTQVNDILQRREALHALMNPMGLGGFKVLLQGKGLSDHQKAFPYRGFQSI